MTINRLRLAPVPLKERCAQPGRTSDIYAIASVECAVHRAALIARFGPPPERVSIEIGEPLNRSVRAYDLTVEYDDTDPVGTEYARRLADEPLSHWHEAGFVAPFGYGESGAVASRVYPSLTSSLRAAIATLGLHPDRPDLAAMRANLLAAYSRDNALVATHASTPETENELVTRSAHLGLLARARAAIDAPCDVDEYARNALVAELDAAVTRLSTWPLPWPVSVYLGVIEHSEWESIIC